MLSIQTVEYSFNKIRFAWETSMKGKKAHGAIRYPAFFKDHKRMTS